MLISMLEHEENHRQGKGKHKQLPAAAIPSCCMRPPSQEQRLCESFGVCWRFILLIMNSPEQPTLIVSLHLLHSFPPRPGRATVSCAIEISMSEAVWRLNRIHVPVRKSSSTHHHIVPIRTVKAAKNCARCRRQSACINPFHEKEASGRN